MCIIYATYPTIVGVRIKSKVNDKVKWRIDDDDNDDVVDDDDDNDNVVVVDGGDDDD